MPNPVQITDLEARFRSLTDAEKVNAQALLEDAWAELLSPKNVPDLEDRIGDGRVSTALVVRVVRSMVLRVLRNPDSLRQWSVDDVTFVRDSAVSAGELYASPEEVELLTGVTADSGGHISFSAPFRAC
jgi:hypothetical protein